jgi:hypothetical protein
MKKAINSFWYDKWTNEKQIKSTLEYLEIQQNPIGPPHNMCTTPCPLFFLPVPELHIVSPFVFFWFLLEFYIPVKNALYHSLQIGDILLRLNLAWWYCR